MGCAQEEGKAIRNLRRETDACWATKDDDPANQQLLQQRAQTLSESKWRLRELEKTREVGLRRCVTDQKLNSFLEPGTCTVLEGNKDVVHFLIINQQPQQHLRAQILNVPRAARLNQRPSLPQWVRAHSPMLHRDDAALERELDALCLAQVEIFERCDGGIIRGPGLGDDHHGHGVEEHGVPKEGEGAARVHRNLPCSGEQSVI